MTNTQDVTLQVIGNILGQFSTFLLNGIVLKLIWNHLLINLFLNLHQITYFQGLLLIVVCGILFKNTKNIEVSTGGK